MERDIIISNGFIQSIVDNYEKKDLKVTSSLDMMSKVYELILEKKTLKEYYFLLEKNKEKNSEEILGEFFKNIDKFSDSLKELNEGEEVNKTKKACSYIFNSKFSRAIYLLSIRDNNDEEEFSFKEGDIEFGFYKIKVKDGRTYISNGMEFDGDIFGIKEGETKNFILFSKGIPIDINSLEEFSLLKSFMNDIEKNKNKQILNVLNSLKMTEGIISSEDYIKFEGEIYEKFSYKNNFSDSECFIESIINDLKRIEKILIKEKISINGSIKINKEKLSEVIDFMKNYFFKKKEDIAKNFYSFDEQIIQRMKVISNNFDIVIEDIEDKSQFKKDSVVYELFKEFINESIELIQKLLIISEIYYDEEDSRKSRVENAIPKNIDYSMNEGFKKVIKTLLDSYKYRRNTILIGHAGFGKTFGCKVTAQLLSLPYYKFACNSQTQIEEFFGSISQNDQGLIIREKGPLTKAIEDGGLFVFDEFNSMPSETIKSLNSVLDAIQSYKEGDTITIQISGKNFDIRIHKDLRICLTGNPSEFTEDYGILSRVTNDLSRRSVVLNTTNLFSGKEFNDSFIEEYFVNSDIEGLSKEDKIMISYILQDIVGEIQLGIGRGSISLKEDNRFFVLNDKEQDVDSTDQEIFDNVIIPVSSIFCLPLRNIIESNKKEKDVTTIMNSFIDNHLSLLFDLNDYSEKNVFNKIKGIANGNNFKDSF